MQLRYRVLVFLWWCVVWAVFQVRSIHQLVALPLLPTSRFLGDLIQNNRDVSNKHLYGVCHTLIHLVDRFVSKNPYLAVPWNRSDELLAIAKCSRSTEEHLEWICSIKERLLQAISSDGNSNRMILQAKKYIEDNM